MIESTNDVLEEQKVSSSNIHLSTSTLKSPNKEVIEKIDEMSDRIKDLQEKIDRIHNKLFEETPEKT